MRKLCLLPALIAAAGGYAGTACAQGLADPTRPPSAFTAAAGDSPALGDAPVLQSVMIAPHVSAAIISGQVVRVGEKYGEARLVRVSDREAVLSTGGGEQVLKLYPGVEKNTGGRSQGTPAVSHPGGAAGATKR